MSNNIDQNTLNKLVIQIRTAIPVVRSGIEAFSKSISAQEELENSYQSINLINDVASMLGLRYLYHIGLSITEMIETMATESHLIDGDRVDYLLQSVDLIEPCLVNSQNDRSNEQEIVVKSIKLYRRFKCLPEDGDKDAILSVVENSDVYNVVSEEIFEESQIYVEEYSVNNDSEEEIDFADELLEGFLLEAEDYLETIGALLPEITSDTQQNSQLQQIRRSVHTLKGAAGIVGLSTISQLAHRMEDVLDDLYDGSLSYSQQIKDVMLATFDVFEDCLRDKRGRGNIDEAANSLYAIYDSVINQSAVLGEQEVAEHSLGLREPAASEDAVNEAASMMSDVNDVASLEQELAKTGTQQSELVRVPIERLDEIVRLVGEVVISRSSFEQHLLNLSRQIDELHLSINRLQRTATTIETQYEVSALIGSQASVSKNKTIGLSRAGSDWSGIHEFDELEFDRYSDFHLMSRELTETSADIGALGGEFRDILSEFDAYLTRQSRLTSEIQDKLMHFRMIPLATLSTRLHRAVRVTARQRGKEVGLIIEGEEVQFDKIMLDELNEALLHILRNAVDHGIEEPSEREALGKTREGKILLRAYREGTQLVVQIKDDGAGLNPDRIKAKAIQNGLVTDSEIDTWANEKLFNLIFAPGFSTAGQVSQISGRGVGMDVVNEVVDSLKGRIFIESILGDGVVFTIRLPVTLSLIQVLIVQVSNQKLAFPLADVNQVIYVEPKNIEVVSGSRVVGIDGKIVPIVWLADALNMSENQTGSEDRLPVIVLEIGNNQVALVVDHLLGGREVVVKTLGAHLRHVHGLIGSTLMGDGSIILILNPSELTQEQKIASRSYKDVVTSNASRSSRSFEILIVDDSFSVRRVVANLIKKAGWQPLLAKNGLEALDLIQRSVTLPDLILLDVEMPQMDGYELTSTLRANPDYQSLPIVMLTSRGGDKHRKKAFEVGATEYVIKPYNDNDLLSLVTRLIRESREIAVI